MESPQLKNGFIQIANEIMDALCKTRLSGEQRQCLDFILRKTYGYNKKTDNISNSQFVKGTGIRKQNVQRSLRALISMNIVIKIDTPKIPSYRFNKRYTSWKLVSKKIPVTKGIKIDSKQVSKLRPTKDSITKDKEKKKDIKENFGINRNVLLTRKQENKLIAQFGAAGTVSRIDTLSLGISSKGYKYKCHYSTILAWDRKEKKETENGKVGRNSGQRGFKDARPQGTKWRE